MKNLGIYTIIRNIVRRTPTTFQHLSISAFQLKKMLSIFLVAAIFFNGFIPKCAEFKNNLKEAIKCAVETQTNFLDKYTDSVINVTNGIASNIIEVLNVSGLAGEKISTEKKAANKNEQKKESINTSADNCIITGNNINNQSEINELKTKITGLTYTKINDETNLYFITEVVHTNGTTDTGILFFILFAILVVRIKDTIAVLYNNRNIGISRLG